MYDSHRLSAGELAVLDTLITIAQEAGLGIDATDDDDEPDGPGHETIDGRHDGLWRLLETELIPRVRELTGQLGSTPTLRTLLELRARAVRK